MSQPVSLNRARKDKLRKAKRAQADANAVKFGRTKEQKPLERAQADKAASDLDGKKRDP